MKNLQIKSSRKFIGAIWIMAVVLLLLMTTILAETSSFGVLDFKTPENLGGIMAQVQDLTGNKTLETSLVRYQLHDALIDGDHVMFTIHCEAKDPDRYMLVPTSDLNSVDMTTGNTYAKLAKKAGKEMVLVQLDVSINGGLHATTWEYILQDGKLYWLLEPGASLMHGTNEIVCKLLDNLVFGSEYVKEADKSLGVEGYTVLGIGEENESTLTFTVEKTTDLTGDGTREGTVRFTGPFESEYATIDWIEYTHGTINTRLRVQFTVHENLSKDDLETIKFLNFKLMNSPDDKYGVSMDGSTGRLDGKTDLVNIEGVTFLQDVACLQESKEISADALLDMLYLRPRYTGRVYGELITFSISEGEAVGF